MRFLALVSVVGRICSAGEGEAEVAAMRATSARIVSVSTRCRTGQVSNVVDIFGDEVEDGVFSDDIVTVMGKLISLIGKLLLMVMVMMK